jgi:glycosyltransferase involved in cell wall biosynthesis
MERASYGLIQALRSTVEAQVIAWGGSQALLALFLPYCLLAACVRILLQRPDVIHLGDAVMCVIGETLKKWFGVPTIVTVHGLDLTMPHRFYQWMLRRALPTCDRIACVSEATAEVCREYGLKDKVVVVPNAIDVNTMPLADDKARDLVNQAAGSDQTRVLLSVARLVLRKGIEDFIRTTLPAVVAQAPDTVYWVVGDGPERSAIERAVAELNMKAHVRLWGRVPEAVLGAIYERADVFVMPNIQVPGDMEGFGIVVLEANLAGLPVVASRLEGLREAIEDGQNGILVSPEDNGRFATEVTRLLLNDTVRREAGERARATVVARYSWASIAAIYECEMRNLSGSGCCCRRLVGASTPSTVSEDKGVG